MVIVLLVAAWPDHRQAERAKMFAPNDQLHNAPLTMNDTFHDSLIGLAGIFQAAHLVQRLARTGLADQQPLEASLYSLFQTHPESTAAVFNGARGIISGLRQLVSFMEGEQGRDLELARYVISLMALEAKVKRHPETLSAIAEQLENIRPLLGEHALLDDAVTEPLAAIYTQAISPIPPRIMVKGEPRILQDPRIVQRIRATLLAGIRSAILWRQMGGTRWKLLWHRHAILEQARELLRQESGRH